MEPVQYHRSKDFNVFFNGKLGKELGDTTEKPLKTNTKSQHKSKARIHTK